MREDGCVVYGLRRPWRDGTSHVVFEPLDFLSRLAALVPPRRAHVLTYHGVLLPASQWRDAIVPGERGRDPERSVGGSSGAASDASRTGTEGEIESSPGARYRWSELLRRVFARDALRCDRCGGRRDLIALIRDPFVVRRILTHLGLSAEPPPRAPARAPPQGTLTF